MTIKSRAVVLLQQGLGQPYAQSLPPSVEEVTIEALGPTEVLVRIAGDG